MPPSGTGQARGRASMVKSSPDIEPKRRAGDRRAVERRLVKAPPPGPERRNDERRAGPDRRA